MANPPPLTPDELAEAELRAALGPSGTIEQRKRIAKAQVDTFGWKPWEPPTPTRDALDRPIVFMDSDGGRYTVYDVQPNGAHVRREHGSATFTGQTTTILVVGATHSQCEDLARVHAGGRGMVARQVGGGLYTVRDARVRFEIRRPRADDVVETIEASMIRDFDVASLPSTTGITPAATDEPIGGRAE